MTNHVKHIKILGELYSVKELLFLCEQKIESSLVPLWEKDIFLFLRSWFSASETITVSTSGSTGTPKKIKLQKVHMIASAKATLSFFSLKKGANAWLCLPVTYIAGKMMIVRAIVGELNLVYSEPNSNPFIYNLQKIEFAAMVPNQVFELLKSGKGKHQLQNIENLLIGGAAISESMENSLLQIPNITAWHSYGMTETITHIAVRKLSKQDKNKRYIPFSDVIIGVNNESQLIINYKAIGVNNLKTNDIANIFEDGSFTIIGRADNVIISGGIKLHPEKIEGKISKYLSNSIFVGGIPDEKLGAKLVLFIQDNSVDPISTDEVFDRLYNNLSKYELPKKIIFLKEFTRSKNGKIDRNYMINKYIFNLK